VVVEPRLWPVPPEGDAVGDLFARASVFDIMRAPRGAAPLMWKQWQTTDPDALR
jgi:hypothetical protein